MLLRIRGGFVLIVRTDDWLQPARVAESPSRLVHVFVVHVYTMKIVALVF
jgi:hypothetical protein